jgi:RNA polymerase sigma-70 factor (ECF subfamily)
MIDDFDHWYAEMRPSMSAALVAWCGDPSIAADALDEAFARAIERWDRVRAMDQPAGWVWHTASNVARRRMRRHWLERRALRRHASGRRDETAGPTGDDVDLRRALLTLTERQRTAVVLHYIADLPQREVGAAMGITEGTVGATLHQARSLLAARLALSEASDEPRPGPPSDRSTRDARHDDSPSTCKSTPPHGATP